MRRIGIAAVFASACLAHAQTITIEIDFAGGSPNGVRDVVPIFDPQLLDVWIYADQPGVFISGIGFDLDGRLMGPVGTPGGAFRVLSGPGALDPDGAFSSLSIIREAGSVDADWLGISGVLMTALPFFGPGIELGVGPSNGLRVYAGVEAQAETFAAMFTPANATVLTNAGVPFGDVRTIGVMQIPGPASGVVLAFGGLVVVRRRRGT